MFKTCWPVSLLIFHSFDLLARDNKTKIKNKVNSIRIEGEERKKRDTKRAYEMKMKTETREKKQNSQSF